VSDEQTTETPAPSELELLRAEVRAGFAEVRAGFAAAASATGVASEFKAVRAEIAAEGEKSRRHMDVVAEGLRESLKVVIDKTVATGKKVDRLIASNAVEHAAFLEAITDHEVRITRLETPPDAAPSAGDR
jgi:hypothetical protein